MAEPKRRIIDLNANGGGLTTIYATWVIRRMEIRESLFTAAGAANVPQGLSYYIADDGTANGFTTQFATVPPTASESGAIPNEIVIGSEFSAHGREGIPIGAGPQPIVGGDTTLGTKMCQLQSFTATPTSVEVLEYA